MLHIFLAPIILPNCIADGFSYLQKTITNTKQKKIPTDNNKNSASDSLSLLKKIKKNLLIDEE